MRHVAVIPCILTLLLLAPPAGATPHDITVKVSPKGLSRIGQEVEPMIPSSLSWPGFSKDLVGCPFSSKSASVALTGVKANVKIDSVTITPGTSRLTVDISGRVPTGSAVGSFYVCIGSKTSCTIYFSATQVSARATFTPSISGGKVHLLSPSITLDVPSDAAQINVTGCGAVGSLANFAVSHVKGWLLDRIESWLEGLALDNVPPAVEKALSGLTSYSGTLSGFKMSAAVSSAATSSSGLEIGASASVTNTTTATGSCAVGAAPSVPAVTTSPALGSFSEDVGVAVSKAPLTKALYAAWRAGRFCMSSAYLKAVVGGATSSAGALLGFTQTDELSAKVIQAPKLTIHSGTDGRIDIDAPAAITVKGQSSVGPATVTAKTTVTIETKLIVDPLTRALMLEVSKVSSSPVTLSSSNSKLLLPKAALIKAAIDAIALPALADALDRRALVPQVLHQTGGVLDPYYLFIARRSNTTSHIKVYAKLFRKVSKDTIAPWTNMTTKPPKLIGAEAFEFVATGGDGGTPTELLRYRWRIDGGGWTASSYNRRLSKAFKSGQHKVEVAAVDLHGNADATPSSVTFDVDAVAPTISVVSAPTPTISTGSATIEVAVNDDRSAKDAIEVSMRLEHIIGVKPTLVSEQPFARNNTKITLSNLQPGNYAVTLVARDEAGNVSTPERVTFTREGSGGSGQPGNPTDPGEAPQPGQNGQPGVGGGGAASGGGANGENPGDPNGVGASVSGGCAMGGGAASDAGTGRWPALFVLLALAIGACGRRRGRRAAR